MSNKYTIVRNKNGRGVSYQEEVSAEELEEMEGDFEVIDTPDESAGKGRVEELSSESEPSTIAKQAEDSGIEELSINLSNISEKWFTADEIEKLKQKEKNEDTGSSIDEIKQEIKDETGMSASEAWREATSDDKSHSDKIQEQARLRDNSGWKDVADGIVESSEETESESPSELSPEELEKRAEAARAFKDRGGVWAELAEEMEEETSVEEYHGGATQVIPREGGYKEVSTSYEPLLEELANCSENDLGVDIIETDREAGSARAVVDMDEFASHFDDDD